MATLSAILEETRKMVATKQAEISGTSPSSLPGAEHDKPVPAEFKQPDPETRDGTMVPTSGLSAAGAGDDSEITRGHALESDEAALTPEKKPAITDDANAKTAADLANEILAMVHSVQKQAAAKPAEKVAEKVAAKPAPAPETKVAKTTKKAGELNMELTTDVMAKIAAIVLSTEEGAAMTEVLLTKAAGANMADETMAFLAEQSELAEKQAAYEQGQADAEAAYRQSIYEAGVADGLKVTGEKRAELLYKLGQAAVDEVMGAAGGPGAEMTPEELEAMAGGEGEGEGDGAMPGADGEDLTEEDVLEALQLLVEDGTLQEAEAEQVLEALVNGGEGGEGEVPPEAGAEGGEPAGAEAPAGEDEMTAGVSEGDGAEAEPKMASVNELLLASINRLRRK